MSAAWVEEFLAREAPSAAQPRIRGYYNDNFVVERDGRRVVVRVPIAGAPAMDVRRIPEPETLALLARHGFPAPRLLARGPRDAWFVESFVDGTPLHVAFSRGGALPDWVAREAARLLRALHAIDAAPLAPWCADLARSPDARGMFRALTRFAVALHERLEPELRDAYRALGVPARPYDAVRPLEARLHERAFALCHVDAHRKNLIVAPDGASLVPLDWELALVADPLYDVAVHFHRMRYAREQEALFLRAYGAPADARAEVDAYLALEAVKASVGDLARYVGEFARGAPEPERGLLAEHYLGKLRRAWRVWRGDEECPLRAADVARALEDAAARRA